MMERISKENMSLGCEGEAMECYFNSKVIKLIVFDLHGTLTNRTSTHPYHIQYRNDYIEWMSGVKVPDNFDGGTDDAFALFPMLDKMDFYRHRDNDPNFKFEKIHAPNIMLKERLNRLSQSFQTVLYTDSFLKQINRTLLAIGLDNIFDYIIGLENGSRKVKSQYLVYPKLCEMFDVKMKNILIVGDRMDKDINPVLKAGGNGLRLSSNQFIIEAIDLIINKFK